MQFRPARPEPAFLALVAILAVAAPLGAQRSDSLRIAPRYGTGLLWVTPLPYTPRELAAMISGRTPSEIHDTAVVRLTQNFLDAMAAEAEARAGNRPVDWTTSVGGQTVGLDSRWIYLGPLKVPTALLALLPLDFSGNPTEMDRARRMALMRDELLVAGRRSANLAEFQEAVRQLRAEREAQRQFERNRRTPPQGGTP